MQRNVQLRGEWGAALRAARELNEKKNGKLSAAEQRKFDDLMTEAARLKTEFEEIEAREMGRFRGGPVDTGGREETTREKDHQAAFRSYLRYGRNEMPAEHRDFLERNFRAPVERRDMGTGGGNALQGVGGGFLVPVGFIDRIETALKFTGNLMKYCTIMPTETGQPMPIPTADDTQTQAELIGEGQQVTEGDVNLSNIIFGAYKYSSKMVKASLELVQDSAFDLETWLVDVMGTRFARRLNTDFTLGSGVSGPRGIITAALAAGNTVLAVGAGTNDGTSEENSVGSQDLLNLIHAVDPLYRQDPSCRFLMSDQTRKKLGQLLDKFGRPLFPQSLISGAPDVMCGYEVALSNAMDSFQLETSSPPVTRNVIAFGPMSKYLVRKVREMSLIVLRERFMDFGQLGYIAFMRVDGNLLTAAQEAAQCPIAVMQTTY